MKCVDAATMNDSFWTMGAHTIYKEPGHKYIGHGLAQFFESAILLFAATEVMSASDTCLCSHDVNKDSLVIKNRAKFARKDTIFCAGGRRNLPNDDFFR
jgi:hypothetical protein